MHTFRLSRGYFGYFGVGGNKQVKLEWMLEMRTGVEIEKLIKFIVDLVARAFSKNKCLQIQESISGTRSEAAARKGSARARNVVLKTDVSTSSLESSVI
jgi:hypothetical protein